MASLEHQQAAIIALLDEGTARAVRVIECREANPNPARSVTEIARDIERKDSPLLTTIVNTKPVFGIYPDLYESWLVESLVKAKVAIAQIEPQRVRDTRRAGQSTRQIFESHINEADGNITGDSSGVYNCLRECFDKQSRYKPEGVTELADVQKLAVILRRRLRIFKSRFLSVALSGWPLILLIVVALLSAPVAYYVKVYKTSNAPSLAAAAPRVAAQASSDAAQIRAVAENSETNVFDKSVNVVEGVWKLLDDVPKILTVLAAAWGLIRAWLRR